MYQTRCWKAAAGLGVVSGWRRWSMTMPPRPRYPTCSQMINTAYCILHITGHHLHNFTHHTCMHQHLTEAPHIKTQIAWHYMALSREGGPIPKNFGFDIGFGGPLFENLPQKWELIPKYGHALHILFIVASHTFAFFIIKSMYQTARGAWKS